MRNLEKYKPWIIFFSGFLTLALKSLFPVVGGGGSIIFLLTIPILIGLSIILALIYKKVTKRIDLYWLRNLYFTINILIILFLTFAFFPCSEDDSPCPLKVISKSINVASDYSDINYNDLFIEKKKSNYPLIVAAQKKFKNRLPDKIYYIKYNSNQDFSNQKKYVIYYINDSIKSDNENLEMIPLDNNLIKFIEVFNTDTISFIGTKKGLEGFEGEFKDYSDNGYGYLNMGKKFKNYFLEIRKEVENDITRDYLYYKLFYNII
jgi:hypothetical protein